MYIGEIFCTEFTSPYLRFSAVDLKFKSIVFKKNKSKFLCQWTFCSIRSVLSFPNSLPICLLFSNQKDSFLPLPFFFKLNFLPGNNAEFEIYRTLLKK